MSGYRDQSAAEKLREPNLYCPGCGIALQPRDLVTHVRDRCDGLIEPHYQSEWVAWPEALALGVSKKMLHTWINRGLVRVRGSRRHQQYLLRDVAKNISMHRFLSFQMETKADQSQAQEPTQPPRKVVEEKSTGHVFAPKRLFVAKKAESKAEHARLDKRVLAAIRNGCATRGEIQGGSRRWLRRNTRAARRIAIMRSLHRLEARGLIYRTTPKGYKPIRYAAAAASKRRAQ